MTQPFDPLDHMTTVRDKIAIQELAYGCFRRCDARKTQAVALEVGSWAGSTALVLEDMVDMVFCVDTWEGTPGDRLGEVASRYGQRHIFETFCRNMGDRLHRSVFPCVGTSATWASVWQRPLDLVFIDADHSWDACRHDIFNWMLHVRPGGTICGHDYGAFPGVSRAVDYLVPTRRVAGDSIWYWEKPL